MLTLQGIPRPSILIDIPLKIHCYFEGTGHAGVCKLGKLLQYGIVMIDSAFDATLKYF